MPRYDDNFQARSETQIQNQFHLRSVGLAPRLNGGRGGGSVAMLGANVNFTHY